MKRNNQKWLSLVCVLAALLVLLLVVALVLGGQKPHVPEQNTAGSSTSTDSMGGQTQRPDPLEDLVIETPFCQLVYPAAWREHLAVEQVSGTEHDVNFYAEFEDMERIFLFSITFSPEQDDAAMVIQSADGNPVGVYLHMAQVTAALSDEQLNEVYSMQEVANDLLEQLG